MKRQFNVMDRTLALHQNYFLEASAGTGKTFSIQNLVVRLIIESSNDHLPLLLDQILVVTFTRASTQDLKNRIRQNIEQTLLILERNDQREEMGDYLKALFEKGKDHVDEAIKLLKDALFTFDQAQIFTIHSFCSKMLRQFALEGDISINISTKEETLGQNQIFEIVRNYFRTEIRQPEFSPSQIEILIKNDPDQKKILSLLKKGYPIASFPSFSELFITFCSKMRELKQSLNLNSETLLNDFNSQITFYNKFKEEHYQKIIEFSKLFDKDDWIEKDFDGLIREGFVWSSALNPEFVKKAYQEKILHSSLTEQLLKQLEPIIEEARHFQHLLCRVASGCRYYLERYQTEEELFTHDDILKKMDKALEEDSFLKKVQNHYHSAIIDEFQDTDPVQWRIFSRLFAPQSTWKGSLYLVGDPKQSIYSFRQADIYTYLSAANIIGEKNCFSLNVNYRAQPFLVQALNHIFHSEHLSSFIPLPKINSQISYTPVEIAAVNQQIEYRDEKGAVHFFIADGRERNSGKIQEMENKVFFPFIVQEIERLKKEKKFEYHKFAVLVRDRYQAMRLGQFLDLYSIPFINQKSESLYNSDAFHSVVALMQALSHSNDRGMIYEVLATPLFSISQDELKRETIIEEAVFLFQNLKTHLFRFGFASFLQELFKVKFCSSNTLLEKMLSYKKGLDFYKDVQQIGDLIIDYLHENWNQLGNIIEFLDHLSEWEENDDERIRRVGDHTANGVKILTLHLSKGLEFEVVFALGLVNRLNAKEELIPQEINGITILAPIKKESAHYQRYCEEIDSEKMRQLYVALTRAKKQLFIPVIIHPSKEKLELGEASPMDLFLGRLMKKSLSYEEMYERIQKEEGSDLIRFVENLCIGKSISYSIDREINCSVKNIHFDSDTILKPPSEIKLFHPPLWMTSFTSLSKGKEENHTISNAPKNYDEVEKNVHSLPANSHTGLIVHSIFEKISFSDFRKLNREQLFAVLHPFFKGSSLENWGSQIFDLTSNTLKTNLPQISHSFTLDLLTPFQIYRELPFVFPLSQPSWLEDLTYENGMIKGVIDLLFHYEGYYYLVDWKTNWLGPQPEYYTLPYLQQAMEDNKYLLQGTIYTEAIKRYLKLVDRRPFEKCFGGVFYLFLRGLSPGSQNGIYHFFPKL